MIQTGNGKIKVDNCFSIDVEGFIESNLQSFHIDNKYVSRSEETYEIQTNVNSFLAYLDSEGIKATFFFLGRIAEDIPRIVRETAECGHEIACHSNTHVRVFGQTKEEFRQGLECARKTLEDVSGREVCGFRAPDFSITKSNLWALDVLMETGFKYDSSICPTGIHDVYGIGDADPFIHRMKNGLVEFPVSVINIFGKRIPFGGGGYFRLYPITVTRFFADRVNDLGQPWMIYVHPYEVGPVIPGVTCLSPYRRFRHYYNCSNGQDRLKQLIRNYRFCTAADILKKKKFIS